VDIDNIYCVPVSAMLFSADELLSGTTCFSTRVPSSGPVLVKINYFALSVNLCLMPAGLSVTAPVSLNKFSNP
jgi:hypothetical protein